MCCCIGYGFQGLNLTQGMQFHLVPYTGWFFGGSKKSMNVGD